MRSANSQASWLSVTWIVLALAVSVTLCLPAAFGEAVRLRDVVDVDADHRLTESA
jgi:hypothetical protein